MTKYFLLISFFFSQLSFSQTTSDIFKGAPVFHGAKVTGNFPKTDFLFTVPATGERPIRFTVDKLPKGLTIDASTGIITGRVEEAGDYIVQVVAENKLGKATEELKIRIGDKLCLTPAMGWNSWNVFTKYIDEKLLIEMADAMVNTGMRDLGYQYINIDDYWHAASRSEDGKPVADPQKFPHGIKYVSDYMHSKGLKLGIYSDAGDKTCGKCFGGFQHEEIDAETYAAWGVDLLKYDFCFVPWKKKEALERYTKMGNALKSSGRSIVYSICNWGIFNPWEWAANTGGNYWRTTPDIIDVWKSHPFWYGSFMSILKKQTKLEKYAGPGHWNDPDMMTVGNYGKGHATGGEGKYKGMTDTEYQSHMSLWCLLNAPLLSSCDLRSMNDATKNILLNAEMIDINQDELGLQAKLISKKGGLWVYKKELQDGSFVVAILNTTGSKKDFELSKAFLKIEGNYLVSNIWSHSSNRMPETLSLNVNSHETIVFRMIALQQKLD